VAGNICLSLDDGPDTETTAGSGQVQVQEGGGGGVVRLGRCFCGRAWHTLLATSQDAM